MGSLDLLHSISAELSSSGVKFKRSVSGKECSTMYVGGELALLVEPQSEEELQRTCVVLAQHQRPIKLLGAGSNILIPDSGIGDVVLRLGRGFRTLQSKLNEFYVGGAMSLMSLSRELSEAGFSGLEFAGGIPASLGGAVRMNAGAHGGEMAEVLKSVRVCSRGGEFTEIPASQLQLSYRRCTLPEGAIVVGATIALTAGDKAQIAARRQHFLAERKARQPLHLPSAGSVFKNPSPSQSAGAVLEAAGMKGQSIGGASVSTMHANWIVNAERRASASDVCALIKRCQQAAKSAASVDLEPELIVW